MNLKLIGWDNRRYHGSPIKGGQWNKVPVLVVIKVDSIGNPCQERGGNHREELTMVPIILVGMTSIDFPKRV